VIGAVFGVWRTRGRRLFLSQDTPGERRQDAGATQGRDGLATKTPYGVTTNIGAFVALETQNLASLHVSLRAYYKRVLN